MWCLFHRWSKWQDVKVDQVIELSPVLPLPVSRMVIKQQRRCGRCNKVQTSYE